MKLALFDISRAHFYGNAKRRVVVELEKEDKEEYGSDKVGLLLQSMYGNSTQRVAVAVYGPFGAKGYKKNRSTLICASQS